MRLCHRRVTPSFRQHRTPPIFLEAESLLFETPCGRFPSGGVESRQSFWETVLLLGATPHDNVFMTSRPLGCFLWRIPFRRRRAPLIFLEAVSLLATSPVGTLLSSSCPA